jgi:lipoprotein-anchoring transpeptidase ErfK/SrfK
MTLVAVVLLGLAAGLGYAYWLYRGEYITPGMSAMGIDLGGYTKSEAAEELRAQWDSRTVLIDMGSMRTSVRPENLGVTLDISATVQLAYDQGRSSSALDEMWRERRLGLPATTVDPVWKYDPAAADRTLQALARQVYIPPFNPSIQIVNGQVETTNPSPGRALDVPASGELLGQDPWAVVTQGNFKPAFVPVQPVAIDVKKIKAEVAPLLASPVGVHLYDPINNEAQDWQIPAETIGNWIAIRGGAGDAKDVSWDLDNAKIAGFVQSKAASLGTERYLKEDQTVQELIKAVKAPGGRVAQRIYHKEREHTVASGETLSSIADIYGMPYPWIQKANHGISDTLRVGQVIKIPSQDELVPLTPVESKRLVVSLKNQNVTAYENGAVKWQWPASTGMGSSPTAPGIYQIQTHEKEAYAGNWDLWMPWFMGVYRPVPDVDFMNGFHGFPRRGGTQILWTNDLGRRVTYGCILISSDNEKMLYDWAQEGVVVDIRN